MGYPTKVQLISRKKGADQYYINFPTAVAEAMEFQKGEVIEWIIEDKANIIAHRPVVPPSPVNMEKKRNVAPESMGADLAELLHRCVRGFLVCGTVASPSVGPFDLPRTPYRIGSDHGVWRAICGLER